MRPRIIIACVACAAAVISAAACGERHPNWTTSTGLKVTEMVKGEGAPPKKGDLVEVEYTARYLDGDEFDSTARQGQPYKFRLGVDEILPGLEEGITSMRPGARRKLILPPKLAYGDEGLPGVVPPGTWVEIEVELIGFEAAPPPPEPWNDAGYEIVTTQTGLQYVDFEVGTGDHPRVGGMVLVHYTGYLDDGTIFDTTWYRPVPIEFEVDPDVLIAGWLEGLLSMHAGGKRKLIVPPHLGYGKKGFGKTVPPNATLTFDIELISVE